MRTQLKRSSKRELSEDTGRNGRYDVERVWICLGDRSQGSEKVFWPVPFNISVFVKAKGLIRKAEIPPPSTHPGEVTQVTLWQGCEPVKVEMILNCLTKSPCPHHLLDHQYTLLASDIIRSLTHIPTSSCIDITQSVILTWILGYFLCFRTETWKVHTRIAG